jgi:hypothetical protein
MSELSLNHLQSEISFLATSEETGNVTTASSFTPLGTNLYKDFVYFTYSMGNQSVQSFLTSLMSSGQRNRS